MLKKILVASVFCLTSSIADAQVQTTKPIICFPIKDLLSAITQDGEDIIWTAKSLAAESYYALTINKKTKEFTLIQFDDKNGCVIGAGKDSKFYYEKVKS